MLRLGHRSRYRAMLAGVGGLFVARSGSATILRSYQTARLRALLDKIYGRAEDRFMLAGGRSIHPGIFACWLYPLCPFLEKYQFTQEAVHRVVVRLQPKPGAPIPPDALEAARFGMARDLGEDVELCLDLVEKIP